MVQERVFILMKRRRSNHPGISQAKESWNRDNLERGITICPPKGIMTQSWISSQVNGQMGYNCHMAAVHPLHPESRLWPYPYCTRNSWAAITPTKASFLAHAHVLIRAIKAWPNAVCSWAYSGLHLLLPFLQNGGMPVFFSCSTVTPTS